MSLRYDHFLSILAAPNRFKWAVVLHVTLIISTNGQCSPAKFCANFNPKNHNMHPPSRLGLTARYPDPITPSSASILKAVNFMSVNEVHNDPDMYISYG